MFALCNHELNEKQRVINRDRHNLEMRTNGTKHDIPNTNHLGEKGRRKKGGLK